MTTFLPLFAIQSVWLTPFWLFTLGVTLGLIGLALIGGLLFGAGKLLPKIRPFTSEVPIAVREGLLMPVLIVAAILAALTVLPPVLDLIDMPTVSYGGYLRSLARLPLVHDQEFKIDVAANQQPPGAPPAPQRIPLQFRAAEVASLEFKSPQEALIKIPEDSATRANEAIVLTPTGSWKYVRGSKVENPFAGNVTAIDVLTDSKQPFTIEAVVRMDVEFPQVRFSLEIAAAFLIFFAGYLLIRFAFRKVSAVAVASCKEGMGQPLFYLLLALGLFCLLAFIFLPQYTFGEDIKMYKSAGLTLILILTLLVSLWTASGSMAEEIEGKTAVTVLSKPIGRRQFVIGKFLGMLGTAAVMFIVLGVFFLLLTSFKVVYDARESAKGNVIWTECYAEMLSVIPGLLLAYMEVCVMTAISVALSTRLPMLPNLLICFSIYVLGHLVPLIVVSSIGKFPLVAFMGQLSATVLPVLDHFNIEAAISSGAAVPTSYLWYTGAYCVLFSAMALLVGLFLFEDRDVA
ncbi:MAG TPA: hypothetical protein VFE24_03815 [Pirellulales bacterium]|jgi:ABC-type transport system involved in multi-copper enzyme maturation permease subunit|nr:hypothetical protein [Pirellulales bacterium]